MYYFDFLSYAKDNGVSIEVYPVADPDGYVIRLRDLYTAATESTLIREDDLCSFARPAAYIEDRCDQLLAAIGKQKAAHAKRKAHQDHRNAIEDFFRTGVPWKQ